ncbi:MAG TPA: hypothetical protein VMO26_00505 [Vicinamibacterales bacterium]|nr:hypothetical protein [Vicinamibacterales bacterium]
MHPTAHGFPDASGGRRAGDGVEDPRGRRGGGLLFLLLAGAFFFLLRDFTSTAFTALLALLGASLAWGGVYLVVGALRHVTESLWYAGLWMLGLAMLGGAAATLSPAAPGDWIASAPPFWGLLDHRVDRLEAAIESGDVDRARTLAARGLGDPAARDASGTPILHLAQQPEMVAALLEAGLNPDVRGASGQTLLMLNGDPEVLRLLLAAGADPNARDDHGFTALMHRRDDAVEAIERLLEAGADVHAVSDGGRTVADLVRGPGRALLERYAGDRELVETGGVTPRGRDDWLVASPGPAGRPDASGVVLQGEPLRPGDVGSVAIVVDNPSARDTVVEVRAVLDNGVLFVNASHAGAVDDRGRLGPSSTVMWPWLSLPSGGQGRLELTVLARPDDVVADLRTGDWSVDVHVVDVPERTERVLQLTQQRAGEPAHVAWDDPRAFAAPLILAGLVLMFWLVLWRRRGEESGSNQRTRIGRAVAAGGALLCLVVAGDLVGSMAEPFVRFEETTCELLDRRVLSTLVEGTPTPRTGRRDRTVQPHPLVAVAIVTGGERLVTAGWSTSNASHLVHELRATQIGSMTRCWIDPDDPRRFTVLRTPSLGGLVGLALLLAVAVPLFLIAWRFGRGRGEPAG